KIDNYKKQIENIKNDPEKLKEVYENITGNKLTGDELEAICTNSADFSKSELINSVLKYNQSQKTAVDVMAGVGCGIIAAAAIAAAPFTGGASLAGIPLATAAFAAAAGGLTYVAIEGIDGMTEKDGWNKEEIKEDLIHGAINGVATAGGIVAGKLASGAILAHGVAEGELISANVVSGTALELSGETVAAEILSDAVFETTVSKTTQKLAQFAASETTALVIGDTIGVGNYLAEVGLNDEVDFSLTDFGRVFATSTVSSLAAGAISYGVSSNIRPFILDNAGTTPQAQVSARLISSGVSGAAAGSGAAIFGGGTNYLLGCLIDDKEVSFNDWLKASVENVGTGALIGTAAGIAFEASTIAQGTPKPEGTIKVQKGETQDGLKYTDYLDSENRVIARDINVKEFSEYLAKQEGLVLQTNETALEPSIKVIEGSELRTIRFNYSYNSTEFSQNGIEYDLNAVQTRTQGYDWLDKSVDIGQGVEFSTVPKNQTSYYNSSEINNTVNEAVETGSKALINGGVEDITIVDMSMLAQLEGANVFNNNISMAAQDGSIPGFSGGMASGNIAPVSDSSISNTVKTETPITPEKQAEFTERLIKSGYSSIFKDEASKIAQSVSDELQIDKICAILERYCPQGVDFYSAENVIKFSELNEAQLQKVDEIISKTQGESSDYSILNILKLDDARYQKALKLLELGVKQSRADSISIIDEDKFPRVQELVSMGIQSRILDYVFLDDKYYTRVQELSARDIKGYDIDTYINLDDKSYLRFIELTDLGVENYYSKQFFELDDDKYQTGLSVIKLGADARLTLSMLKAPAER
ncbi:hypothetical protein IJ531_05240, partial [bacterium]|nr:hypothetical protein [bacterium]